MKPRMQWAAVAAAVALLAACGGGGSDTTPAASITSVKVMGDSLADSGTFGLKFTVQGTAATGPGSTPIWPERVAASYNQTLCAHYRATSSTTFTSVATCGNYAVGGGRINNYTNPTSPISIQQQLRDAGAVGYAAGDLVLIDGGGNDAADLIGAYLLSRSDTTAAAYRGLLRTVLDATVVDAATTTTALAQVGGAYMQALATQFATTIKAQTVAKGASRVAVLNMPPVTLTPRLRMALSSITDTAVAAQAAALFDGWVQAFNAQLATSLAGDARITVVDFYTSFKDQNTNPAQYSFTNTTTPVCPITGVGTDGLPTYTFATCTAAALSAMTPPAGSDGTANWWQSYAFADSFHPTPYAHQQMGQLVSRSLSAAGWL